jgi:predicted GNAT family acetyltransferase
MDENGSIKAVFVRLANGILLHCASDDLLSSTGERAQLASFTRESLKAQGIRCVMGSGRGSRFLESLIARKPVRAVDYVLMARDDINPPQSLKKRLPDTAEILRCSAGDAESLLPLQEGYEREEVVPPGEAFSKEQCRANLEKALAAQSVYAVRIEGRFVAKAGTNARGFAWDQLGGIYTAPEWRGRGIAQALVAELIKERSGQGKRLALFAKVANEPAKRAYASAGFVPVGE